MAASFYVAALEHFESRVSRLGAFGLPRASRALSSWMKAAPSSQRFPFPWVALCAVIGLIVVEGGRLASALHLLVTFRSYLRPGASDVLRVKQLVPPQPMAGQAYQAWGLLLNPIEDRTPGKTGLLDEAILLDSKPWLHPFFVALTSRRDPEDFLWPARGAELVEEFQPSLPLPRPSPPKAVPVCSAPRRSVRRPAHASQGAPRRQKAGRLDHGRQPKEVYGKETRLLKEIGRIPPSVLAFGSLVSSHLPEVLRRTFPLPLVPQPGFPQPTRPEPHVGRGHKRARLQGS